MKITYGEKKITKIINAKLKEWHWYFIGVLLAIGNSYFVVNYL